MATKYPWSFLEAVITALRKMGDMATAKRIESKHVKGARGMNSV